MGWGITLNTEIYYSKVNFKSKQDVINRIEEIDEEIAEIKSKINKFVYITEPRKFIPDDCYEDIMGYIDGEIDGNLQDLEDLVSEQTRLYILADSWDDAHHKDTKKAMVPYNPNELNRVWMHGDFIDCCTPDGKDISDDYWSTYSHNKVE